MVKLKLKKKVETTALVPLSAYTKQGIPRSKEYRRNYTPDPIGSTQERNAHRGRSPRDSVIFVTPEGKKVFAYNEKGTPICFSHKTDGTRCQSVATHQNGRCRLHGGKAPSGVNHWNADPAGLRTSVNMPTHLQANMRAALNDEDQLNLKHEIALSDVKLAEQKEALTLGLGKAAWKVLRELADRFEGLISLAEPSIEQLIPVCERTIDTIRNGVKERELWKEIDESLLIRKVLVEAASKREVQLRTMLQGDQALALMTAVAGICKEQIAKNYQQLEEDYQLIDRNTGKEVARIDIKYRNDFQTSIGVALRPLVAKSSPISNQQKEQTNA